MKRFHIHVGVQDVTESIDFYTRLFGQAPTREESDYAKWMLEDPRINFAISARDDGGLGVNHLGMQATDTEELAELHDRAQAARPVKSWSTGAGSPDGSD